MKKLLVTLLVLVAIFTLASCEKVEKAVEEATAPLRESVEALEKAKSELETEKASLDAQKAELEAQKAALETQKSELEAQKAALESDKAAQEDRIEELEADKTALETQKAALESDKAAQEDRIEELEADKTALETQKAELEAEIEAKEKEIAAIRECISSGHLYDDFVFALVPDYSGNVTGTAVCSRCSHEESQLGLWQWGDYGAVLVFTGNFDLTEEELSEKATMTVDCSHTIINGNTWNSLTFKSVIQTHDVNPEDCSCNMCYEYFHSEIVDCQCTQCGVYLHELDENCVCTLCGGEHYLKIKGVCFCYSCYKWLHNFDENCKCTECGTEEHQFDDNCVCTACGRQHDLSPSDCECRLCGETYHNMNDFCTCDTCGKSLHEIDTATGICSICNTMGAAASITDDGVKTYYALIDDAIKVGAGKTIVLENDCKRQDIAVSFKSGTYVIDLNGFNYDCGSNIALRPNNSNTHITVLDSKGGGGMKSSNIKSSVTSTSGTVVIKGGSFDIANFSLSDGAQLIIYGGSFEQVYINDYYGTLEDVLPEGYCFYDAEGNVVDVAAETENKGGFLYLYNVTVGEVRD